MVSFELGKEVKKYVFRLVFRAWNKEKKTDACHMNFVVDLAHRRPW